MDLFFTHSLIPKGHRHYAPTKGEISQKEGESLVNDLQKALDENKAKLTAMIDQQVRNLFNELNLATKTDLAETEKKLKKDLANVEKHVAELEKQMKPSS